MLHIRALVKAETVLLFDTYGSPDTRLQSMFLYHLEVYPSLSIRWIRVHVNNPSIISKRKVVYRTSSER